MFSFEYCKIFKTPILKNIREWLLLNYAVPNSFFFGHLNKLLFDILNINPFHTTGLFL